MTALSAAYIGIQRGGGLVGWLTRLVTRSRFGHSLIAFDDVAFSADGKAGWGFQSVSAITVPTRWYTFTASAAQIANMQRWCHDHVGWGYDRRSVLKFTTPYRMLFPSREAKRDRGKLFCSEGVYGCIVEGAGLDLLGEVDAYEVAPGHFRFSSMLRRANPPTYQGAVL